MVTKERAKQLALKACDWAFYTFITLVVVVVGGKIIYEIAEHPFRTLAVVATAGIIVGGIRAGQKVEDKLQEWL